MLIRPGFARPVAAVDAAIAITPVITGVQSVPTVELTDPHGRKAPCKLRWRCTGKRVPGTPANFEGFSRLLSSAGDTDNLNNVLEVLTWHLATSDAIARIA